ncbi:MAG: class I adenylate-forming enzyme family protein, partial [Sphingobium sp.]
MSDLSIFARFRATAARWPDKPFLDILSETADIYGIAAGEISYAEMLARVVKRSDALAAAGYGEGTRVGVLLHNRPEFLEIFLAANRLGASIVPINPDLRRSELEYLIAHSEMAAAFVLPDRLAEMSEA